MNVLIIEDDPAIILGLEELLKSENYNVTTASDGEDGFVKALSINPSIIILDINLPVMNGLDVCRKLRENKFVNPIIMLTARTEQLDKIVGLEIGADDYITKPFNSRELIARVRAQLRRMEDKETKKDVASHIDGYRRKLLSIMFTDMKDYSKKMNLNEILALNVLKNHNQIMNGIIKDYGGRIIETIGDSYLNSFDSAVDAVNCARKLQQEFKIHNKNKLAEERIEIRIGIHLGDVIEFENKLKGDTLNIAARIQQMALPETIYISNSMYEAVKNKSDFVIEKIGEQRLKNIKDSVTIFEVKT